MTVHSSLILRLTVRAKLNQSVNKGVALSMQDSTTAGAVPNPSGLNKTWGNTTPTNSRAAEQIRKMRTSARPNSKATASSAQLRSHWLNKEPYTSRKHSLKRRLGVCRVGSCSNASPAVVSSSSSRARAEGYRNSTYTLTANFITRKSPRRGAPARSPARSLQALTRSEHLHGAGMADEALLAVTLTLHSSPLS